MQTKTRRFGARGVALAVVAAAIGVLGTGGMAGAIPSGPQSITVNDEAEYRAALATLSAIAVPEAAVQEIAPAENTIVLAADITLTQQGQDPAYTGQVNLRIDGQGHTIDAADKSRVLFSQFGVVHVTLDDLIAENGTGEGFGGAIYSGGYLTLEDATVQDSEAGTAGGGVYSANVMVMENSSLLGNSAPHGDSSLSVGGGAYVGSLQATASTIAGNTADMGGGVHTNNTATLLGSTVSGNTAMGDRGYGGGLSAGDVTLDNSTVTGNSGERVGGILAAKSVTATLSTIAGNTTTTGPANVQAADGVSWTSFGTVIADPTGGPNCLIADGPTESSYSYATDSSCTLTALSDVQDGADPQLGDLADNGGPTETLLPGLASPLLDRIPAATCESYPIDQRTEPRPEVADTGCDVGSVEGSGDPTPPALCFGEEVTVFLSEGDAPTEGKDVILGTPGDDVVDALDGSDRICGLGGADTLTGGIGLDYLSGGGGPDELTGGIGPDVLNGNRGYDVLVGSVGVDRLGGGYGNDTLRGGPNDDQLVGGWGTDHCNGGSGTDSRFTCETIVGFP